MAERMAAAGADRPVEEQELAPASHAQRTGVGNLLTASQAARRQHSVEQKAAGARRDQGKGMHAAVFSPRLAPHCQQHFAGAMLAAP